MNRSARVIAYYLPQFHPIPENDEWWGKGFTEWRNVAAAKPLFRSHYQPHIPADLGFYDLRVPETRAAQAEMAREHGIEGFCYWHYWMGGGKQLLQRPFEEVLKSGEPNFPFCLGWANHSWTGIWFGAPGKTLMEQTYPGMKDHEAHFYYLLKAFKDDRYITVDGNHLLVLFRPYEIPDCRRVTDFWRELTLKAGLKGLHIVALDAAMPQNFGCDATVFSYNRRVERILYSARKLFYHRKQPLNVFYYKDAIPYFLNGTETASDVYPTIVSNWDSSPRLGVQGTILHQSTPESFRIHVRAALNMVINKPFEQKIIFAKSWNEWAEGNHLEPDLKYGKGHLEVLRDELANYRAKGTNTSLLLKYSKPFDPILELGNCNPPAGREEEAQKEYAKALSFKDTTNIQRFWVLGRLGNIYLKQKKYKEAAEMFSDACSIENIPEQESFFALKGLAQSFISMNRYEEADAKLREALAINGISEKLKQEATLLLKDSKMDQ